MYSIRKSMKENSSTPKRRRLGMSKNLRSPEFLNKKNPDVFSVCSPISLRVLKQTERCESPPLPCNQIEYLCDSGNNSSTCSEIPCSPGVLNSSVVREIENWDSLLVTKVSTTQNLAEIEDISDDMFYSRLEQSCNDEILTSRCEQHFRENIEETFAAVNDSIYQKVQDQEAKDSLFETKDSFLLDIKETCIINENGKVKGTMSDNVDNFYGLPVKTKSFFKSYRNIEKFYDWQEECLNLDAIRERRNLIYALPTSGGKTLVAEVLMLREVLNNKKNVLFILPFVAIVQEKIWALSPFAVNLDFLVEEYAAGKGNIPPKKRRSKHSIYIATIEKGLALVRSLIELGRLSEIGLMVVDELHLIGEAGRGATLETLLSTVLFANQGIQIVGMSATIGNLPEVARFLRADIFQRDFRPVTLDEYVKLGSTLYKISAGGEAEPERELNFNYTSAASTLDPDCVGGLVSEVVPSSSCLVFCPTKRNCENVANLLCKLQRKEMALHRTAERQSLEAALKAEGAAPALARSVRYGVAYHHSGLASDERTLLEQAFRSGVISVVCCTSTLAAGVNLPARRVIIRAPRVGRGFLALGAYRQMCGRAGRAGVTDTGESIIICSAADWPELQSVLRNGLPPVVSCLTDACCGLVLSGVALQLADTRSELRELLKTTFMATSSEVDIKKICDDSIRSLIQTGALDVGQHKSNDESHTAAGQRIVYSDSKLTVSKLGRAAIKGCMELSVAKQMLQDLESASRGLVLMGSLHLLYLVTPHDAAGVRPDYRHYYSLYCNLDEDAVQTAKILGITEMNAIRMMTGKPITNVSEKVLCRFYVALMLYDLWKQAPFHAVADKYCVSRGIVQTVMASAAALASSATRFCEELEHLWTFRALFSELSPRLAHCAAPELSQLMELPAVKKARALQLMRAGFKRVEDLAKASLDHLTASVAHLSRSAATHLVSAARMMLIEKVENLRAEAEDVMEELKV
ncbi:helicase POLQ-like [Cydia splendana]|uniref:helicase POLQ-like n=1 Tax=Cydia splendana TaxID=1100963 RepID=UPI0028F4A7B0